MPKSTPPVFPTRDKVAISPAEDRFHPDYYTALEGCASQHAGSKTFSGSFLRHHADAIGELIKATGAKTLLDYGCGKAMHYQADPELIKRWGVDVTLFDPAHKAYSRRPRGKFDIVICVQVLCWVPINALDGVIADLYKLANSAIYVAEKIAPIDKELFDGQHLMLPNFNHQSWLRVLHKPEHSGTNVMLATREPGRLPYMIREFVQ